MHTMYQKESGQVQSYKRKITYFYEHHNGNIGTTAGFLKLEIRGDKVKIIINIQEPPGLSNQETSLYFYHEAGDHLEAVEVDKVERVGGILTYQTRTDWQEMFNTGRDLYTFDGVAVVYDDSHYYIGDFQDKNRKDYALVKKKVKENVEQKPENKAKGIEQSKEVVRHLQRKEQEEEPVIKGLSEEQNIPDVVPVQEKKEEKQTESVFYDELNEKTLKESGFVKEAEPETEKNFVQEEKKENEKAEKTEVKMDANVYEKCKTCPYNKKREAQRNQEDTFEKMLAEYPKLPMYNATELFDCVRIHPKDIGKLDMRNWKLGVNSFLTHGYYTYQYLLLGKMRFDHGKTQAILGVPGVYSNREKYLANMFGFEQFIPIKKTGVKTGEFGYWIVEISPYL